MEWSVCGFGSGRWGFVVGTGVGLVGVFGGGGDGSAFSFVAISSGIRVSRISYSATVVQRLDWGWWGGLD